VDWGRKADSARLCSGLAGLAKFERGARCSERKIYKDIEGLSELSDLEGLFLLRPEKKGKKMLSKKQLKIREFELSDLEYVKDLIKRTIDICYRDVYCKEIMDFFDMFHWGGNILKTAQDGYIVVAEVQGEIVGTGSLIGGAILRVFVDPAYQKQGIGKMIMNELEMRATMNGVETVQLRALANAKKFYESLGYLTVANSLVEVDNGRNFEYYQMEKRLK